MFIQTPSRLLWFSHAAITMLILVVHQVLIYTGQWTDANHSTNHPTHPFYKSQSPHSPILQITILTHSTNYPTHAFYKSPHSPILRVTPGAMLIRHDIQHLVPQFRCDHVISATSRLDQVITQFLLFTSILHRLGTQRLWGRKCIILYNCHKIITYFLSYQTCLTPAAFMAKN